MVLCYNLTLKHIFTVSLQMRWLQAIGIFIFTFCASPHDGLTHIFSVSILTVSNLFWNKSRQQSIILMIRCGGLASFLTVAMSAGLIVCKIFS